MNNDISHNYTTRVYLQYVKATLSDNTFRAYSRGLDRFIKFLTEQDFDIHTSIVDVNIDLFIGFLDYLDRNIKSIATNITAQGWMKKQQVWPA